MTTSAPAEAPVEKVSQDEMLKQFKDRYAALIKENQDLTAKIKENEVTALKLQGAIETLEYYGAATEVTETVPETPELTD